MGFWHTGVPNGGEALGWLGRLADDHGPDGTPNYIVNVASSQSLAVRAARHSPLVFDDPGRLRVPGAAWGACGTTRPYAASPSRSWYWRASSPPWPG